MLSASSVAAVFLFFFLHFPSFRGPQQPVILCIQIWTLLSASVWHLHMGNFITFYNDLKLLIPFCCRTIALRYPNGTFTTAYAQGMEAYQETMARLSLESSQHTAPPYGEIGEEWGDSNRVWLRKLRKMVGLPASYDVGVLGKQIRQIIAALDFDPAMNFEVTEAAISVPHLLALYQDDISDACEYAKIKYLELPNLFRPLLWETSPAFAGYGVGLCEHFRDHHKCVEEIQNMTEYKLLTVHYSKKALTTSLTPMTTPFGQWEPDYRHTENFDLGFDELEKGSFSGEDIYWGLVNEELHVILERFPSDKPTLIVLTGNAADVPKFREILQTTFEPSRPFIHRDDVIFAVAKGTAEMYLRKVIWEDIRLNRTTEAEYKWEQIEL